MSESSPAGGAAERSDGEPAAPERAGTAPRSEPVSIELETSRQRVISWTFFGIAFGALLVWKLGTVAVWAGWILIAIGLVRAVQLVLSFVYPAGTIVVSPERVELPLGLHRAKPLTVKPAEVTAVYFLRRSVPWNRAAPVLVVELGPRALLYPRDWFASEADQRHVVHALVGQLPD